MKSEAAQQSSSSSLAAAAAAVSDALITRHQTAQSCKTLCVPQNPNLDLQAQSLTTLNSLVVSLPWRLVVNPSVTLAKFKSKETRQHKARSVAL